MQLNSPVLMIGLDATEISLIEQLCNEGKLPAIQSLRQRGCFGALQTDAIQFAGGVWPTFYTSKPVSHHGIYHNKLWHDAQMRCEIANDTWLPEKPFWERLGPQQRVAVVDVPMTVATPQMANGVQIAGWGTHDLIVKGSWPATLWQELEHTVGDPTMPGELFGPQNQRTLLQLREQLLKATEQVTRLSETLLSREHWDLFLVVLGATHRGGHYLWDLSQIDQHELTPETRAQLEGALVEIYQACDKAVARLIEAAPPNARVVVFAVHGMGPNTAFADRCADILAAIQRGKEAGPPKTGLLYRIKKMLPWPLVRQITSRLPTAVTNRLVTLWSAGMYDWKTTRYFPVPMDHAGYVRINLKGREAEGIVEPGAAYEALCDELSAALLSFRDIATGKPIVARVYRLNELAPPDAPYRNVLPDLLITWSGVSAIDSPGVRSEQYGEVRWQQGRMPSGRAGNHRGQGWFVAAGGGIAANSQVEDHSTLDLVPTVLEWLEVEPLADLHGKPISALCPSLASA